MNAKSFLKQPEKIDKMIENKLNEKERWRSIALSSTAQMGGERVQSSGSQQKMADAIDRFVDIDKEIDEIIDQLVDKKKEVISVIEQLNATEYDILHKVYIQYKTFQDVADSRGKSKSWVKDKHKIGVRNVQKILDERSQN